MGSVFKSPSLPHLSELFLVLVPLLTTHGTVPESFAAEPVFISKRLALDCWKELPPKRIRAELF